MTIMPDSIVLTLPEQWEDIPLEDAEYREFVEEQLEAIKEAGFDGSPRFRSE